MEVDWISSMLEVLRGPLWQQEIEEFFGEIRKLTTTKEVLLRILQEVDWEKNTVNDQPIKGYIPNESRGKELLLLCSIIDDLRKGKPKTALGVKIATDPCIIEILSDWLLPPNVLGIETLLSDLNSDELYQYFMIGGLTWHTEEDYDQSEVEKRFTRFHQNLMIYNKSMSPTELREWADDLPSLERADMLGSDPHPLFVRSQAIASYFSSPSWVQIRDMDNGCKENKDENELGELPDLDPVLKPDDAMANISQTLLNVDCANNEKYEKALARLRYTYQLIPYSAKKRFILENGLEQIGTQEGDEPDSQTDDIEYFHRYGPVNTGNSSASECVKYGGCRMLLCCCQVLGDEDWDDNEDMVYCDKFWDDRHWFKHSCDVCGTNIRRKEYAIRLPAQNGGWYGCYCSYNCQDSVNCSSIEEEMKAVVKEQLEKNKIYV